MDRRRFLRLSGAALVTPLATALAGCGQGDGGATDQPDGGDATPTASPTPESTPESTPTASPTPTDASTTTPDSDGTPTPSPTPTASPTPRDAAQVVDVGDGALSFSPESFEISTGDTVVWVWDSSNHNVKPSSRPSGSKFKGTPGGEADLYDEGYEFSFTFETPGEYEYYCSAHRSVGMTGAVTVTE